MHFLKKQILLRTLAMTLTLTMLLPILASCGKKETEAPTVTLNIMSWNDDFRNLMEDYFIPTHSKLMKGVSINWITDEISGYASEMEKRLNDGECIDIFLANESMTARFSNNENTATLASLGIFDTDLAEQYPYTRMMARNSEGVQMGSAYSAEPGLIIYRTDYAEEYLGITHREEMQELLSSWDTFLSTAKKLNEKSNGNIKMVTNSSEVWMSVKYAMTGLWVTDGKLNVSDDVLSEWLQYIYDMGECKSLRSSKLYSDDWYSAVNDSVFCFFSAPWLNKNVSASSADISTIFSAAVGGKSFGKWEYSLAPNGFAYGGNWLYSSKNSPNKELVGRIIREFTCNSELMKKIALSEMCFVNNTTAIDYASNANIINPMFVQSDAFSLYSAAANGLEISLPSVYDNMISSRLYDQAVNYKNKKVTLDEAIYNFKYNVWKKNDSLLEEPVPLENK